MDIAEITSSKPGIVGLPLEVQRRKAICETCPLWLSPGCALHKKCDRGLASRLWHRPERQGCRKGKWKIDYGQGLNLRNIPGVVYTAEHLDKWKGINTLIERFRGLVPFVGKKAKDDFRVAVARDYGLILSRAAPPYMILEDDCFLLQKTSDIEAPADADIVMLGGAKWGWYGGGRRVYNYGCDVVDDRWMRVYGMLVSHANLYLTAPAIDACSAALLAATRPGDQIIAGLHKELKVYCLREPLLAQATGLHHTLAYGPTEQRMIRRRITRRARRT
jgi:hypothetical protein